MSTVDATDDRLCFYCNGPAKNIKDGEHVIPQAIGGALTIVEMSGLLVCHKCNNGVLGLIDRELCSRSYLAYVASQELNASLWQMWDVDHAAENQLVETRPDWVDGELNGMYCYPQMIFESGTPHIRCNPKEAAEYGHEAFEKTLVDAMHDAFQRHKSCIGKKGLFFEPVETELIPKGCKLDPRVFTRHTISEIAKKKRTFIVRYKSNEDKEAALNQLAGLSEWKKLKRWKDKPSSQVPSMANVFDLGRTLCGLMKIGVNLLAAFCKKTNVSRDTFLTPIQLIRGEFHPHTDLFNFYGFARADDLAALHTADKSHAFRLSYFWDQWNVYLSFFGGRIGAFVAIPGPNNEEWKTLDIVAPLHSNKWQLTYAQDIKPIVKMVQWHDLKRLAPTIKLKEGWEQLVVETVEPEAYR
jgi:hypothetical protein